jgi:glyoxylase-like metal-dependent hydrolase (beta-lactamase superfamily II)/8-oxo-dGTP pyrophosphatase MutT (NUDIX family)
VSDITAAASVLLARSAGSPELFSVRRSAELRFFGGFHAFPGGKVHPGDAALASAGQPLGAQQVAAVRELFEETGVLLAHDNEGHFPARGAGLATFRSQLLAGRLTFAEILASLHLHLRLDDLTYAGSLVTPAFTPIRFDTAFFVATLPPDQSAEVLAGELDAGEWQSADAILEAWTKGRWLVSPPTVSLLQTIRGRPVQELPRRITPLLESLAKGDIPPIWFNPGVLMLPLYSEGLPPSTHTNAYLVGADHLYLIDPGANDPAEQQRLFDVLDRHLADTGKRLNAVVLTHQHPDHIGAATICAARYKTPILGHPLTARALAGKVDVVGSLEDGSRLELGHAPNGSGSWHLQALHTPGHASGHLCFYEPLYQLLFVGDMVSTLSSVIIAPPDGDLAVYLDSLRLLQRYPARLLLPAHGSPSSRPALVLEECVKHRQDRERQLLDALGDGPRSVRELAVQMYRGLPAKVMRFAEMQVLAGLRKLENENRVRALDEARWQRI